MDDSTSRESITATVAAGIFFLAVLVVGIVIAADQMNLDVNVALVGGFVLGALGFVGLAAVMWVLVRKFLR